MLCKCSACVYAHPAATEAIAALPKKLLTATAARCYILRDKMLYAFYTSEPLRSYYGTALPSAIFFDRPKKNFGCVSDL